MMAEELSTDVVLEQSEPKEVAIAESIIPYPRNDPRGRYLGFLACGLSVRETLQLIGRSKQWLSNSRTTDPLFFDLETRIPEFRKKLSQEYIEIEFFRNFRLVLEKDYRVIKKSLSEGRKDKDGNIINLSRNEQDYLLKLRSQYSPQQMQILESVIKASDGGFNFAQFVAKNPDVVQFSRTDTVTVKRDG